MEFSAEISELEAALLALNGLNSSKMRKHIRRGVTKAGRVIAAEVKAQAPKETGLLAKSIGSRVWTAKDLSAIGATIGPRAGFRRAMKMTKKGKIKTLSKKATEAVNADPSQADVLKTPDNKVRYRNPRNYAHLVEGGVYGKAANGFMRRAISRTAPYAMDIVVSEVRTGIRAGK